MATVAVTVMEEESQLIADDENSVIDWSSDKKEAPVENVFYEDIQQRPRGPSTRKQQKYRKAWEFYPEFTQWLEPEETSCYKAKCKMCNKVMVADISVLKLHATGKKHIRICDDFNKAKATLESMNTSQPGRANLPTTRKLIRMGQYGVVQRENSSDISFENLTIADSTEGAVYSTAETSYTEQTMETTNPVPSHSTFQPRKPVETCYMSKAMVSKPAPPWKATAIVNGHVTRLELADYKGRYVILFFYPQDFSAVCPTEILALSDRVSEFRSIQTEIVACSVDSHLTHLAWARTPRADGGLANPKIPLLADPTHTIARDYGVLLPDAGHALRAHFIIDRRGILRHMAVNDTYVGRSIDELLRMTQAIQQVDDSETGCPADWKPGLPTV